jgi:hypothetical protein
MGSGKNKIQNASNQGAETAYNNSQRSYGVAEPGYEDIAKTGGITPAMQTQTGNTVASIFSRLKANLARRKALQGGYNPGFAAQEANLGRQGSEAAAEAVNNLNATATQNRLQALGGASNLALGEGYLQPANLKIASGVEAQRRGVLGTLGAVGKLAGGVAGSFFPGTGMGNAF